MREAIQLVLILIPVQCLAGTIWLHFTPEGTAVTYVIASVCCGLFGFLALWLQERGHRRDAGVSTALGSILVRTLGPIASAILIGKGFPQLEEHRIFHAFVSSYLLTLLLETILSVRLVERWDVQRTSTATAPEKQKSCDPTPSGDLQESD
ncbi:MAG: hypothetical protein KDA78_14615 [Planctomycetaceae bacterium]|nr:hypothetical protein [Planctomycetaceae bacterium]